MEEAEVVVVLLEGLDEGEEDRMDGLGLRGGEGEGIAGEEVLARVSLTAMHRENDEAGSEGPSDGWEGVNGKAG